MYPTVTKVVRAPIIKHGVSKVKARKKLFDLLKLVSKSYVNKTYFHCLKQCLHHQKQLSFCLDFSNVCKVLWLFLEIEEVNNSSKKKLKGKEFQVILLKTDLL